jgi:hypothetical protein
MSESSNKPQFAPFSIGETVYIDGKTEGVVTETRPWEARVRYRNEVMDREDHYWFWANQLTRSPHLAAQPAPVGEDDGGMTPEEVRLEDLKQMATYAGPIVSFEVREPYYLASCDHCGWVGSSELCGTDSFGDDSDVYCPRCSSSGADCGKVAETIASALRSKQAPTAPDDGGCVRCSAVPRTASGLCNTCLDEDAERAGEIKQAPTAAVPSQDVEVGEDALDIAQRLDSAAPFVAASSGMVPLAYLAPIMRKAASLLRARAEQREAPSAAVGESVVAYEIIANSHPTKLWPNRWLQYTDAVADADKELVTARPLVYAPAEQREASSVAVGEEQMREAAEAIRPKREGDPR